MGIRYAYHTEKKKRKRNYVCNVILKLDFDDTTL